IVLRPALVSPSPSPEPFEIVTKSLQNLWISRHVHSSQLKSTQKPDEPEKFHRIDPRMGPGESDYVEQIKPRR
ncbi:MAG TPA: hypothetical protein VLI39_02395, partial [Sedimentisphaerales bacterium]|nr:hypothetical protein [Sedimentisphaerales bacterium]